MVFLVEIETVYNPIDQREFFVVIVIAKQDQLDGGEKYDEGVDRVRIASVDP
jgi:hypothetical protein